MGYPNPLNAPQQQQAPFAIPAPQQQQPPQLGPPPQFINPYPQQDQSQQAVATPDQLTALVASFNDVRNQVSQLTAAVNGLGQNQTALHDWLVAAANNLQGMVAGIAQSIKNEGALGFLKTLFTNAPIG